MSININSLNCLMDLHIHLDGSLSLNSAKHLAEIQNIILPDNDFDLKNLLSVSNDCKDLNEYLEKFDFPVKLLQTREAIEFAFHNLADELAAQGLMYAEIRFAPQKHTLNGLSQRDVVSAAIDGLQKSSLDASLILCCMRDADNMNDNIETVKLAKDFLNNGVVAVDLAGAEALFPNEQFDYVFSLANELNIPLTIHAGEADGPKSVYSAIDYGAKRIGHGVRSAEDDNLIQILSDKKITLECCPTSNLNTQVFSSISDFPIKKFIENDVRFTINTDNTAVSDTNLKNEWQLIIDTFNLTYSDIRNILQNTVNASFADDALKSKLYEKINKAFEQI